MNGPDREPRARTIEAAGMRLRVLEVGDEHSRGAPLLLVHGIGGWAECWSEVMPALAADGRRAIAVDLPGFGESTVVRTSRYFDPEEPFYARTMIAALDALGVERAHLVGNSLGGAVAFSTAVSAPDRAASLVLVAAGGVGLKIPSLMLRALGLPGMGLLAKLPRPRHWADEVLVSCFWDRSRVPAHLYAEARGHGNRSFVEFVRVMRTCVGLGGVRPALRERWVARAREYAGPVLAIWGEQDAVLPSSQAAEIPLILPQAEVALIEACGHLPQIEQPDLFIGVLLPFLERAEAGERTATD